MRVRLRDSFGLQEGRDHDVGREPTTLPDAEKLAAEDKFQFQAWALGLVGARTASSAKKGADGGIDGRLYFQDGSGQTKDVIFSVKGGNLKADDIRALGHVVEREKADIGVLITLHEPTSGMRGDAASGGEYISPWGKHPRLQILTIKDLLDGKKIDMPQTAGANVTFKQAPKVKATADGPGQLSLMDDE